MGTRTISWVSPTGTRKTLTLGGTRRKPKAKADARFTFAPDSLDRFMEEQRERVARNVQAMYLRLSTDGMTRRQRLTETDITRRA